MPGLVLRLLLLATAAFINSAASAEEGEVRLADMADKLAGTTRFSVTMNIRYDALQESGQLIEFSEQRDLIVQRPQNLRVEALQSDGDAGGLIINGNSITQFNLNKGVYSQIQRSGDIDESIRYAVGKLGIRFPLARLLVASSSEELEKKIERVDFVENVQIEGLVTEHIAAVGTSVDSQFWIRPDKLPARIVLIYKDIPGQPRFSADFVDWNLAPDIGPDTFNYLAPPGTERVPVLIMRKADNKEAAE